MKKTSLVLILMMSYCYVLAQSVEELYKSKNFGELVKYESKSAGLAGKQLYMIGYAFAQLDKNEKAVEFYDKAIKMGFYDAIVHYQKAESLRYLKKYEDAMKEVDLAISQQPGNQEFVNKKGIIYYYQGQLDKALQLFIKAKQLSKTYSEPFFWIAQVYHEKGEYDKALKAFYEAAGNLDKTSNVYFLTLTNIGQLEYAYTRNYSKAAKAYGEAIKIDRESYELYPKLMKAYNSGKEYSKADSIFKLMQIAFVSGELPEDYMKFMSTAVDEYDQNGQKLIVYRCFLPPGKKLDISYKVYLISREGDKIERTFLVEQTASNLDGAKHILCETNKKTGMHYTYPYGWKTETVPLLDLEKAVGLILDGKLKFGAASKL
jgi:tetratricopeptide (TPR) repeat protein